MPSTNAALKADAIRLRTEEYLSYNEIHDILNVPKATLSGWLRGMPLPPKVLKAKMATLRHHAPKKERGAESILHQAVPAAGQPRLWKAKVAEAAVLLRLVMHGFNPFGSVFDGDKTDWLVEDPSTDKVHKIQVKWASHSGKYGLPFARLQCRDGHSGSRLYQEGEFGFLVAYDYFTDTCYVWSWDEVVGMTRKTIEPGALEAWGKIKGQ